MISYPRNDYLSGWEFLGFILVTTLCGLILVSVLRWEFTPHSQPDCSKCHYVEHHETKKMVSYLFERGYKDPQRWLK